jgi:hypothetical protein
MIYRLSVVALGALSLPAAAQQRTVPSAAQPSRLTAQAGYEVVPPAQADGCESAYRSTSVRYTVVGSRYSEGNPPHLVLQETTRILMCESMEGPTEAQVTVVARPAMRPGAAPAWTIRQRGEIGAVADDYPGEPLYRITEYGCCGSENLDTYYSLVTGRALFTADNPLLFIDAEPFGTGLVAIHDGAAAGSIPGATENDRTLIALIAFGNTRTPGQHVQLRGPSGDFSVFRQELVARGPNGQVKRGSTLGINDELTAAWSVSVVLELESITSADTTARIEIPIEGGRLAPAKARVPAGFRVVAVPTRACAGRAVCP